MSPPQSPKTGDAEKAAEAAAAPSVAQLVEHAKAATDKEHNMTLLQGIRLYPKAVFWSMLISTCIVMEGYDVCLVSNFFGFDTFNRKYGVQLADGTYQVPARVCFSFYSYDCLKKTNRSVAIRPE